MSRALYEGKRFLGGHVTEITCDTSDDLRRHQLLWRGVAASLRPAEQKAIADDLRKFDRALETAWAALDRLYDTLEKRIDDASDAAREERDR